MANPELFQPAPSGPPADTINEAGGPAYALPAAQALAQLAATGCFQSTFYASAETQLGRVLDLAAQVEPELLAKTAVYARSRAYLKDMPALLLAVLSTRSPELLARAFPKVVDSARLLRTFVQIVRSGVVGRRSLGSVPKRLVRTWLEERSDEQIFFGAVGSDPSLADVVKMVHPKPSTAARRALYGYLLGREHAAAELPPIVRAYEAFKTDRSAVPDVPFHYLSSLQLGRPEWTEVARNAPWQTTRMCLNTFLRHGVFDDAPTVGVVAERLRDPAAIRRSRVFPYQLLVAYKSTRAEMPRPIVDALHDAMEIAIENVPRIDGKVYVFPDVSGSMGSPVTGHRKGGTSKVRCVDVAALVAAAIVRRNPTAEVVAFEVKAIPFRVEPRDTVISNATRLAALPAGGTACSAPLRHLNTEGKTGDLLVYVSDNESWIDSPNYGRFGGSPTETLTEWKRFQARSPKAKMMCIDLQPYVTTQVPERADVVNVGGFSDDVFRLLADVATSGVAGGHWLKVIDSIAF